MDVLKKRNASMSIKITIQMFLVLHIRSRYSYDYFVLNLIHIEWLRIELRGSHN